MARGTSSTQSAKNNKIIDRLHNIIRAGGINNYVLRVDFIAILYLMRRFEEEIKSHQNDYIGEIFHETKVFDKKMDTDLYRFSRLNEITDAAKLQKFVNDEVIPFYRELPNIVAYPDNKKPSIYETNFYKYISEFFRDATISKLKSGRLKEVISLVSEIESSTILSDDFLGDAVESAFANSTSAERKQMGLFRTPKHIRDLMVEMAKPTIKDKVYDPAVGTGGFLISAKNYIFKNIDLSSVSENELQKFYFDGLGGMEQDMFLHRFAMMVALTNQVNPLNIQEGDSLGNFDYARDRESYSLILTNPPFGGEKNQDHYSNLWAMNSSETTVLFLKLMYELLSLNGRCVTVVSEGMNTWSDATSVEMRRIISEDNTLEAVISLPQGVFQNPKGGIGPKTSIYFFRKTKPQKDHKVFFYQIENDGYSIGTNRKEIKGSQIPDLLEMWSLYVSGKYEEINSNNCYLIPVTKITSDSIYSFNISSYLSGINQVLVEDYQTQINKINKDLQNQLKNINSIPKKIATAIENYREPIEAIAENVAGTASVFNSLDWQFKDNLKLIDDHIKQNLEKLNTFSIPSNVMASMATISEYRDLNENILKRGNSYTLVDLGKLIKPVKNKVKKSEYRGKQPIVSKISFADGKIHFRDERTTGMDLYLVPGGSLLTSKINVHQGAVAINDTGEDIVASTHYLPYEINTELVMPQFLVEIMRSVDFIKKLTEEKSHGIKNESGYKLLKKIQIPIPSIEKQKELVKETSRIQKIIESSQVIKNNFVISISDDLTIYPKERLENLITDSLYGTSKRSDYHIDGYPVLRINNIGFCKFNLKDIKFTELPKEKFEKLQVKPDDMLIVRSNGNPNLVGKCAVWEKLETDHVYASYLVRFRFDKKRILPKYVMFYLMSPEGRSLVQPIHGGGTYNFSASKMKKISIPVPPLQTQEKIINEASSDIKLLEALNLYSIKNLSTRSRIISEIWK